jgi:hypothetical protein
MSEYILIPEAVAGKLILDITAIHVLSKYIRANNHFQRYIAASTMRIDSTRCVRCSKLFFRFNHLYTYLNHKHAKYERLAAALLSTGWGGIENEAEGMRISEDNPECLDLAKELPSSDIKNNLWMEEYLRQSTNRLEALTQQIHSGETIDRDSRDWMLNQVDFIVESLGNEPAEIGNSLRSSLLQFILAIAHLDQRIRNQFRPVGEKS